MVDRNDRNFSQNEHTFIKETIKEPPINKKRIAEKLLLASACGIAFGVCAVFTVMLLYPRVFRNLDNSCDTKVAVTITPSEKKTEIPAIHWQELNSPCISGVKKAKPT